MAKTQLFDGRRSKGTQAGNGSNQSPTKPNEGKDAPKGSTTRGHVDKRGSIKDETGPGRATREKVPQEQRHAQRRKDKRGSHQSKRFPTERPGNGSWLSDHTHSVRVGRKKWLIEPVKLPDLLSGSERLLVLCVASVFRRCQA